jgi:soluble lytic murein transglycosylase-like protein
MGIQKAVIAGGVAFLIATALPSLAEEKIQAVVSPNGRIVFTNLAESGPPIVDNAPAALAPLLAGSTDVLAEEIPVSLRTMVDTISLNHGVDPALVRAVIKTESNFNRWAVSNKGARGLMQLIPETGSRYGVRDFFDPQQNVEGGVQYLKFLLEKFNGNLDLSLAAYNAGENLVERLGRIPPIPETTNYVRRVRANYVKKTPQPSPIVPPLAKASEVPEQAKQETPNIFRTVDERGVVHFSNIGPPNSN